MSSRRFAIDPRCCIWNETLCFDGVFRCPISHDGVIVRIPRGVTINHRQSCVGDRVFVSDLVVYSATVLASEEDLTFEWSSP